MTVLCQHNTTRHMNINFKTSDASNAAYADNSLAIDLLKAIGIALIAMLLGSVVWAALNYFLEKIPMRVLVLVAWVIGAGIAYALLLPFQRVKWAVTIIVLPIALLATAMCLLIGDIFAIALTVSNSPDVDLTFPEALLASVLAIGEWLPKREIIAPLGLGLFGALLGFLAVVRKRWQRSAVRASVPTTPEFVPANAAALPNQLREVDHLGAPQYVFRTRMANKIGNLIVLVPLLLLMGWLLVSTVGKNPPSNDLALVIFIAVIGLGMSAFCMYHLWRTVARWNESAVIFENGFAHYDGKALKAWGWHELAEINSNVKDVLLYGIIKTGTRHKHILKNTQGEAIKLQDDLKNVAGFVQLLQDRSFSATRERAVKRLEQGDTVEFGKVALNRDGITIRGAKPITWDDIFNVSMNNGVFTIKRASGSLFPNVSVATAEIANADLLMSLLADESKK